MLLIKKMSKSSRIIGFIILSLILIVAGSVLCNTYIRLTYTDTSLKPLQTNPLYKDVEFDIETFTLLQYIGAISIITGVVTIGISAYIVSTTTAGLTAIRKIYS